MFYTILELVSLWEIWSYVMNKWFSVRLARTAPALRLFCFPHVGAGTSAYNSWPPSWAQGNVELWAVRLPGREQRLSEMPFQRMGPLIDALYEAMAPHLNPPYAFYGHSLGALIGFEMARRIRLQRRAGPVRLLVSAHSAPQIEMRRRPLYDLPRKEFEDELRRFAGTPEEVLQNQDLMDIMMQMLRADFEVNETYSYQKGLALDCPISVFGGLEDHGVSQADLAAWSVQTSREFSLHMLKGDHFFVFHSSEFLARLLGDLRSHLARVSRNVSVKSDQ
jgi:medium-chain acyl-[acyl-carrier-protein] hydrolase